MTSAYLTIVRCTEDNGQINPQSGVANRFEALVNPQDFSRNATRKFSGDDESSKKCMPIGKAAAVTKYAAPVPEKLTLTVMLDSTGAIPGTADTTVSDQVKQLRKVSYEFDGDEHEPPPCKVTWGQGIDVFYGRLKDLNVDYTMFRADGTALRAKIKLEFIEAVTEVGESAGAKRKSPDMTHVIRVREGDTLPLLCQRVYKDGSKYLAVARHNKLDSFRQIQPNTILQFPPMR